MHFIMPENLGSMNSTRRRSIQTNRLSNRDLEQRLQYAVKLDIYYNKQIALKTKQINNKLVHLDISETSVNKHLLEKRRELKQCEETLQEYQNFLSEFDTREVELRHQIAKLKKKITELSNNTSIREPFTSVDRVTYTKNWLKLRILQDSTRLNFREIITTNRTKLEGYVAGNDQFYPFEQIIEHNAENQINDTDVLWNSIKTASTHLDEWQQLFAKLNAVSEEN